MRFHDYLDETFLSMEKIESAVINHPTQESFYRAFRIGQSRRELIYAKYGVRTYHEMRVVVMAKHCGVEKTNDRDANIAILIGMVLGNGHIDGRSPRIKLEHKNDNLDYLTLKVRLLNAIFPQSPGPEAIKPRRINHSSGKTFFTNVYSSSFLSSKYFDRLKELMLDSNGRKIVKKEWFDKMSEESVFLWFLDDGTLPINKKDRFRNNTIELCTDNFTLDENELLVELFRERWGISFIIKKIISHGFGYDKSLGNVNYRLALQSMEQVTLFLSKFVVPFKDLIPKSMHYKCCPQVYWSAALATFNLCGKECSSPCPLGIPIKRNEVLANGSSGDPAKI
jgi:hypothetical protein